MVGWVDKEKRKYGKGKDRKRRRIEHIIHTNGKGQCGQRSVHNYGLTDSGRYILRERNTKLHKKEKRCKYPTMYQEGGRDQ